MSWIKKGNNFLSDITKIELKKIYGREKNSKAKLRLLSALKRKNSETIDSIALSLEKPKTTIHDWLKRFEDNGLDKIYDKKQPGKSSRLTKEQLKELNEILNSSPEKQDLPFILWTTKLIQYIIIKKFNVKYEIWNIRKIVHNLKFVLKVPRQQNKKANEKLQEAFKKNLKLKYKIILNTDLRSSVLMKPTSP